MSIPGKVADVAGYDQPASSSSSMASMSSSAHLTMCFECKSSQAVFYCLQCTQGRLREPPPLCAVCEKKLHIHVTSSGHELMEVDKFLLLKFSLGSSSPTDKELASDFDNKFIIFSPLDNHIHLLPRLGSLVEAPGARPSLVTFIGPTGVGKSTLIRILLSLNGVKDAAGMPLAGAPKDPHSTSADIHMYAGGQVERYADGQLRFVGTQSSEVQSASGTDDSTYPLLYLDCEGTSGSKSPRSIWTMLNEWKKMLLTNVEEHFNAFIDKRFEHVQISYPRMLYIFSDVLCFVFQGDWREIESVKKPLLEWGRSAAAGVANWHRPRLIIIFNKTDKMAEDQQFDDSRETYKIWLGRDRNVGEGQLKPNFRDVIEKKDGEKKKKLEDYYLDPQVFLIPSSDVNQAAVIDRVTMLSKEILNSTESSRKSREEKNQLLTRRQLQQYMQRAANTFSNNSSAEFDIYNLASMARKPDSIGREWYISEFRKGVEEVYRRELNSLSSYKKSLEVLKERIGVAVLLWITREKEDILVGPNAQLPKAIREILQSVQETIDGEEPCASVSPNGFPCDLKREKHKDQHASGKIRVVEEVRGGKKIRVPEAQQWPGEFTLDVQVRKAVRACRLVGCVEGALRSGSTKLDVNVLSGALRSQNALYPLLQSPSFYQVCVTCMIELPTEMLSCGHIICAMCAKEVMTERRSSKVIDLECPVCSSASKWWPNDLPPLAGFRILSLDGGGVRGIVELLALQKIMSYFHGMHVEDLFDMIVGTSTGGIIALALTVHKLNREPMRLPDVIKLFEKLSEKVFSGEMTRPGASKSWLLRICQLLGFYDTKYKNENLLKFLKEHFGEEESLLSSCVGGPRVIVTSCERDDGKHSAAWFTSYNRESLEKEECVKLKEQVTRSENEKRSSNLLFGRVSDPHLFTPTDAAAATSAACTFFPAYEAGGRFWLDGGLRFNGPAPIAILEARIVWPKRGSSALISLGCGKSDQEPPKSSDKLLSSLKTMQRILTDAEWQNQAAMRNLEELQPNSSTLRLNPIISGELCKLDAAEKIPSLKESTTKYLETGEGLAKVEEAANILFANLFYVAVDIDEDSKKPIMMSIRSRTALPQPLRDDLVSHNKSPEAFSVVCTAPGKAEPVAKSNYSWTQCTWEQNGIMKLPFKLDGLHFVLRPLEVMVKLHWFLPKTTPKAGWSLPISGMPFSLT